jgi:hypothetical protein
MSEISFLMNFSDDQQLRGKEGYSLATFQTAVGFLNHFGEDQQLALSLSRGLPLQNEDAEVDEPHNVSPNYLVSPRLLPIPLH